MGVGHGCLGKEWSREPVSGAGGAGFRLCSHKCSSLARGASGVRWQGFDKHTLCPSSRETDSLTHCVTGLRMYGTLEGGDTAVSAEGHPFKWLGVSVRSPQERCPSHGENGFCGSEGQVAATQPGPKLREGLCPTNPCRIAGPRLPRMRWEEDRAI